MTDILTTLKSKAKLRKAVASLKDQQIIGIIDILQSVLKDREVKREEEAQIEAEKQKKIAELKQQMKEAGLTAADLAGKTTRR